MIPPDVIELKFQIMSNQLHVVVVVVVFFFVVVVLFVVYSIKQAGDQDDYNNLPLPRNLKTLAHLNCSCHNNNHNNNHKSNNSSC